MCAIYNYVFIKPRCKRFLPLFFLPTSYIADTMIVQGHTAGKWKIQEQKLGLLSQSRETYPVGQNALHLTKKKI